MDRDLYEGFAERTDLFWEEEPELVAFFRTLFSDNHVRRVLDCACGTGRELLVFHSLGCEVVGSDISDSMLAQASKNLFETGVEIPLVPADYRDLPSHFDERFDALVCLSASIVHVPNEDEALRAFRSMYEVLSDEGLLVLDQGITDRRWNAHQPEREFSLNRSSGDVSRVYVVDRYSEKTGRYDILDIFHGDGAHDLKVWSTDVFVLLRDDQETLLTKA